MTVPITRGRTDTVFGASRPGQAVTSSLSARIRNRLGSSQISCRVADDQVAGGADIEADGVGTDTVVVDPLAVTLHINALAPATGRVTTQVRSIACDLISYTRRARLVKSNLTTSAPYCRPTEA